jgi:hypothetical protein
MSKTPIDPEEALAGPLYVVAALLIVIPLADFALSVAAPVLSSVQWRFAAVGLLSGFTLTPILGIAMMFVISAILEHRRLQRVLSILCLTIAVVFIVMSAGFVLDVLQLRASVPLEGRPAFQSAWTRALLKHVLAAVALGYLGWRARRMIPAGPRPKTPRTVHVVSK